jgi:hypothetical protein
MLSTAEHKFTAWDKFLFGVLKTNLFNKNNAKRTSFSFFLTGRIVYF